MMNIETTKDGRNFVRSKVSNQGYKLWFATGMKVLSFLLKMALILCAVVYVGECESPIVLIVKSIVALGVGYICYKAYEKIDESF